MITNHSQLGNFPKRESSISRINPQQQIKETMKRLHSLLEEYAPAWYSQQLHDKVESALQLLDE